ncbi:MAG: hypothetical protein AAGJ35_07995 [Myxococcota bacterium]
MWMGAFWCILGVGLLVAPWLGGKPFLLPGIGISIGWLIIGIGILRMWIGWSHKHNQKRLQEIRAQRRELEETIE